MSHLSELIEELCPNGVEWVELRDIFDNFSGMRGVSNKWKKTGNCRFIEYMNAYKNLKIDVNRLPYATVKSLEQNTLIKGNILLTSASEVPDECAIASVIEDEIEENIFMDGHLFGIQLKPSYTEIVDPTYVCYFMHTFKYAVAVPSL